MPELSIIVPVYKVEKYLPKCIDSILAQTFRDFELILIDDGSPDNCGRICDEYAARDPRIKVIHQENAGVSAARNAGLDIACGTYLGFVDSDDWIEPEMYETMIATAKEQNVDVVVCAVRYFREDGVFLRYALTDEMVCQRKDLQASMFGMPNPLGGGCCNKIFRINPIRECRFRKHVAMSEDRIFLFECYCRVNTCAKISDSFYNITERIGSATRCNSIDLDYQAVESGRLLLLLACRHSRGLECLAADKFLDDCLWFGSEIHDIGRQTGQPYRMKMLHIKFLMLKTIIRAYSFKLLPKAKLHGYIMGMIKL